MIEKGFRSYKVPENRSPNKPDIEFSKSVEKGRREIWKKFSQCKKRNGYDELVIQRPLVLKCQRKIPMKKLRA